MRSALASGISAVRAVERGQGRLGTLTALLAALEMELRGRSLAAGPVGPAMAAARRIRKQSRREIASWLADARALAELLMEAVRGFDLDPCAASADKRRARKARRKRTAGEGAPRNLNTPVALRALLYFAAYFTLFVHA